FLPGGDQQLHRGRLSQQILHPQRSFFHQLLEVVQYQQSVWVDLQNTRQLVEGLLVGGRHDTEGTQRDIEEPLCFGDGSQRNKDRRGRRVVRRSVYCPLDQMGGDFESEAGLASTARTGESHQASTICREHPAQARYLLLPTEEPCGRPQQELSARQTT